MNAFDRTTGDAAYRSHQLRCVRILLSSLLLIGVAARVSGQAGPLRPNVDIFLLLDKSPSMETKRSEGGATAAEVAKGLRRQFAGLADFYDLNIYLEIVDFGGI